MPAYVPWRLFEWWYAHQPYAPEVFNRGGMIAAAAGILGVVVAVIGSLWRARQGPGGHYLRLGALGGRARDRQGRAVRDRRRLARPCEGALPAP